MAKTKKKQNKELGVGSIIAMVVAGLLLIGILAGVVWYVHSGKAGVSQSAGLITTVEPSLVPNESDGSASDSSADTAKDKGTAKKTRMSKEEAVSAIEAEEAAAKKTRSNLTTQAASADTNASGSVVYKSKVTATQLGKYYDADTDAFRKVYDGKTVTVTGKLSGKSAKMLYVELATGTKVPLRVYLNSEEQREQFNALKDGSSITVKGNVAVLYPMDTDSGGFQEMANGLIALDTVSLVK